MIFNKCASRSFGGSTLAHAAVAIAVSFVLTVSLTGMPIAAYAESLEDLQAKIEETNATYEAATKQVEDLEQQIQNNEARIQEIENQLPEQRSRAAASIANMLPYAAGISWDYRSYFVSGQL
ncbi:hypothetical protein HMPREF1527_00028 [Atopobium sp. oral taxon 199 str. F0494]|nr:hypothetical protein HMPREF1527_00028 [Atopobium sp. oral taxon 199 str. F0494]